MIGIVIAMDSEAEVLIDRMETENMGTMYGKTFREGKVFGKDAVVVVSGVGKVNAAAGTCAAISRGADVILNFGVAGGLKPENTAVGEVFLIDKAVQYDVDCSQPNGTEIGTLDGETENFLPLFCPKGLGLPRRALGTGDRFNDSPDDHALLLRLGCDIRDMEGGAVAEVCKYAGVPCISVKAVSDVYGAGSTTEQFRMNLKRAMLELAAELPEIIAAAE